MMQLGKWASANQHDNSRRMVNIKQQKVQTGLVFSSKVQAQQVRTIQARAQQSKPLTEIERATPDRVAYLKAKVSRTQSVKSGEKPLEDYMSLPASQYSVLDARKIERISESTFKCYVGGVGFFGFVIEPVLTVDVSTHDKGCEVQLLRCQLQGSPVVENVSGRFKARMKNYVQWVNMSGGKGISSDTEVQVDMLIPSWFRIVSKSAIESTGSGVVQRVLNTAVPRFLSELERDYLRWASGDQSRKPLGDGQI